MGKSKNSRRGIKATKFCKFSKCYRKCYNRSQRKLNKLNVSFKHLAYDEQGIRYKKLKKFGVIRK